MSDLFHLSWQPPWLEITSAGAHSHVALFKLSRWPLQPASLTWARMTVFKAERLQMRRGTSVFGALNADWDRIQPCLFWREMTELFSRFKQKIVCVCVRLSVDLSFLRAFIYMDSCDLLRMLLDTCAAQMSPSLRAHFTATDVVDVIVKARRRKSPETLRKYNYTHTPDRRTHYVHRCRRRTRGNVIIIVQWWLLSAQQAETFTKADADFWILSSSTSHQSSTIRGLKGIPSCL